MSDTETKPEETKPAEAAAQSPATPPSATPPAAPAPEAKPEDKEKRREFTDEELKDFKVSEELQEILASAEEEVEKLEGERDRYVANANRQVAAFDGAIQQQQAFADKALYLAKKRFVEKKEKKADPQPTPPPATATRPRTRNRAS